MVKKTMKQIAAIKKSKENKNKDTSQKLATAIQLHPRGDFVLEKDYNIYKKLVQGGMSAREACKQYQYHLGKEVPNSIQDVQPYYID